LFLTGGKKILVFCEKVDKSDIEVHFTYTTKSKPYIDLGIVAVAQWLEHQR
jgi:hypothetical protein